MVNSVVKDMLIFLLCLFFQKYLSDKEREEEQRIIRERQRHLEEVLRQKRENEAKSQSESITDQEMVDSMFDFLPPEIGQEGQAPVGFEVRELKMEHVFSWRKQSR